MQFEPPWISAAFVKPDSCFICLNETRKIKGITIILLSQVASETVRYLHVNASSQSCIFS